jgi:uncharacterized protein (DUF2235 family)
MKRIVILIDGTWNNERQSDITNIAKLDPGDHTVAGNPLIKATAANGIEQKVFYHEGVGSEPDIVKKVLGGAIGLGLKQIIKDAYTTLVQNYAGGDEIYILGFSRGAYAARALAGLIGASGIQRTPDPQGFEVAWSHYRVDPKARQGEKPPGAHDKKAIDAFKTLVAQDQLHVDTPIKCVGVFDTVGSYGIPAGFGFAALARYIVLKDLGFHDTKFGKHIDFGLHAVAVDERRRPFVPTFWTARKDNPPRGHVEQTWFAGVHCNVGGGYTDAGLSDRALVWMIARLQALTGLEFDNGRVTALLHPNLDGEVVDSSVGWVVDQLLPHSRAILSPNAIDHGALFNSENPNEVHINERVHWSVLKKYDRPCTVFGAPNTPYRPSNLPLPSTIASAQIADPTPEELVLVPGPPPPRP